MRRFAYDRLANGQDSERTIERETSTAASENRDRYGRTCGSTRSDVFYTTDC
jgi:hypothetical protein